MKTTKEQREIWRKMGTTDMQNLIDDFDNAMELAATVCDEFSLESKLQGGERDVLAIAADRIRALK